MTHYMDFIVVDSAVMMGKPTIKGTRITVEQILEDLSAGKSVNELLDSYPQLSAESIHAVFAFAADALKGERSFRVAI